MALRIAPYNMAGLGVPWGATPTAAVVQSATADANYPAANIYDGQTSPVCKWASLGTDYYFDVVLNRIANGDFEQASAPSWTAIAGSVSRVASPTPFKGSYCLALTPSGTPEAYCYQDVRVKAGELLSIRSSLQGNTRTARLQVIDLERGGAYYLNSLGAWSALAATYTNEQTTAAWLSTTVDFTAPTFADWGRADGYLRIKLIDAAVSGSNAVYFDEVLLYPRLLDVVALCGHNLPATSRLRVFTYSDYWWGGGATTLWDSSVACKQPTGWYLAPSPNLSAPFARVQVSIPNSGTATRYPQLGELFLGRTIALPRTVRPGLASEWGDEQPRTRTRGALWAQRDLAYPTRKFSLELDMDIASDATMWNVIRDDLAPLMGLGTTPCLLLPGTVAEPDWCLYGNFADTFQLTRDETKRGLSWKFEELPVPLV